MVTEAWKEMSETTLKSHGWNCGQVWNQKTLFSQKNEANDDEMVVQDLQDDIKPDIECCDIIEWLAECAVDEASTNEVLNDNQIIITTVQQDPNDDNDKARQWR